MSFETMVYRDKDPVVLWRGDAPWRSCQGQRAWIKIDGVPTIILHPPANPSASSSPWNGLKIDTGCNASLLSYPNDRPVVDLMVQQLKLFGPVPADATVNPTEIQFFLRHDPRRGDGFPRVSCAIPGITSLGCRLSGDVVAVGIGDPPDE